MNKQLEALMENQKKLFDFWSKASQDVMESFDHSTKDSNFLEDWYKRQQEFFTNALKVDNPQEALEKWPQQAKKWMEIQQSFTEKMMDTYKENASKMGMKMPEWKNGFNNANGFNFETWRNDLTKQSNWMMETIFSKMPFSMRPHLSNFNSIYNDMEKYWDAFQKMIQFGMYDPKGIEKYFAPDAYYDIMGKFMGFKPVKNMDGILESVNAFFNQYIEFFQKNMPKFQGMDQDWQKYFSHLGKNNVNPIFQATLATSQMVNEGFASMYDMPMAQNKEMEILKLMNDLQFAYTSFLIHSANLQSQVFESGYTALPETVKEYYHKYRESKELPDYDAFFQHFFNVLENHMLEFLNSKEYSELQSEVAELGVTVKSKLEQMAEIAFQDFPFLTKSHADEVAQELSALRKKIRQLEYQLESHQETPAAPNAAKGKTTQKKNDDPKSNLLNTIGQGDESTKDDLKKIKGVGPKLEKMLNSIGIYNYNQISKMTEHEYNLIDSLISSFQGRAKRDDWAKQAKQLMN